VRSCGRRRGSKDVERPDTEDHLEDNTGLAHGALQVKTANVLPILLEKRDQKVDRHHGVGQELIFVHVDVTDGNSKTENLLQLELDGALDISDLVGEIFLVRDWRRELASLGKTRT